MKTNDYIKYMMLALMLTVFLVSCSSNDEDENTNGSSTAELVINDRSFGKLAYAYFMNNGDGTGSFMFSNQNISEGFINQESNLTYLSVRIPYSTGNIPTGSFSGSGVDADFDVNRIISSGTCDMTGWSLDLSMTVQKSSNGYVVTVYSNKVHILNSDDEVGDGVIGTLKMNYEGSINFLSN